MNALTLTFINDELEMMNDKYLTLLDVDN